MQTRSRLGEVNVEPRPRWAGVSQAFHLTNSTKKATPQSRIAAWISACGETAVCVTEGGNYGRYSWTDELCSDPGRHDRDHRHRRGRVFRRPLGVQRL